MFNVVLFEPEIPPNTGNAIRLCANAGPTEIAVFHAEAEWLHQVEAAAGIGTEPDGVAGVGRNLRFEQDDIEHLVSCS